MTEETDDCRHSLGRARAQIDLVIMRVSGCISESANVTGSAVPIAEYVRHLTTALNMAHSVRAQIEAADTMIEKARARAEPAPE